MKQILLQIPEQFFENHNEGDLYTILNRLYIDCGIEYRTLDKNIESD